MIKIFALIAAVGLLTGCAGQSIKKDMTAFRQAAPSSILIVPIANKSLDVDAPNYVFATLPVPLAEKGYYVFPVNTAKVILAQEGFYEGDRVHQESPAVLAKLFDADAVLYVTIHRWDAQYALVTTTVTVEFEYKLFSKNGSEIWSDRKIMKYQPRSASTGNAIGDLVAMAITAAMARASPNYMPLTRQVNSQVFSQGPNAIPDGPYRVKAIKPQ
jgi:hypothetical protein